MAIPGTMAHNTLRLTAASCRQCGTPAAYFVRWTKKLEARSRKLEGKRKLLAFGLWLLAKKAKSQQPLLKKATKQLNNSTIFNTSGFTAPIPGPLQQTKLKVMKKFTLFATLTLLGSFAIHAHNYQTYFSDNTIAFGNQHMGLKFQRVDSVHINQQDSVFWFFPNFDMDDHYCIQPHGPNWSGRKVIICENGDNVFFNKHDDSILVKTQAELHNSWLAYSDMHNYKIFAEVVDHDTLSFLGVTDSVKTIGFQVYDLNNDSIEHVLNNRHLKISKNYGLVKTFLFRDFPGYSANWGPYIEYDIKGISSPELGIQNLTWTDVFGDFYPGDELHVMHEWCYGCISEQNCGQRNSIFKYVNRIEYEDSVKYSVERIESLKTTYQGDITGYNYTHDTLSSVISFQPDNNFNKLSEEPIIRGDEIFYNLQSVKHAMTKTLGLYDDLERISDDCWMEPISDILYINPEYMKGLGGPYYWASMWHSYTKRQLVYHKKGDQEWGSPLTIVDETGIAVVDDPIISVFPNPAKDYIRVKVNTEMPVLFEIIDLHGSVLIYGFVHTNKDHVDISKLKAGVYIYRVKKGEMVNQTGKLLIE